MNAPLSLTQLAPPALLQMALRSRHGTAVLDGEDRVCWLNDSFSALTGRAPDEVLGQRIDELLGWDAGAGGVAAATLRTALQWPVSAEHVLPLCRLDGSRFWAQVELLWLGDNQAAGARWGVTLIDLSGRQLGLSELHKMITTAAVPMIVRDEAGQAVECNITAQALFGVSREQILASGLDQLPWRVTDSEGIDLSEDWLPEVMTLQTGQPVQDVTLGVHLSDGRRLWLNASTSLLARDNGQPPWVVTHFDDVTAQQDRQADVDRHWQRLLSALDGSRISIWERNLGSGEMRFDDRAAGIIGQPPEAMWPPTVETWRAVTHPDDDAGVQQHLQAHVDGKTDYYEQELRLQHVDGSWRWVRDRGKLATRTPDGRPEWMYGTREDITERKQAELAAARDHTLLQALFNLAPIGIELIDLTMSCSLLVNTALTRILGQPAAALLSAEGAGALCPDWMAGRARWFDEVIMNDRFGPAELEVGHPDGRRVHLVAHGVRINVASRDHLWLTIQDVTAARAMEHQLRAAANEDRLTGLANRASLLRQLQGMSERAQRNSAEAFGLLFLDFDRFKQVNDTLGHEAGDDLLRGIASRLRQACRRSADGGTQPWVPARLGGDEFVVLTPRVHSRPQAERHAGQLLELLAAPYLIKQQSIHSSASIGIALSCDGEHDPESMLRNADIAMYEAKRQGRRRAVYFDAGMHARIQRTAHIENALREALGTPQLFLAYQPIVDLESGRMTSAEALLRWMHPDLGSLSPAEFIPIAEESGQILAIGEWVLREACTQWTRWQRSAPESAPAMVSVNLSRVQLTLGERLLATVHSALQAADMPAQALQLEVTEREVMRDPAGTRELMQSLRAMGVKLTMDDFGTGVSSLGSLRDLPFDTIKIDKSFVTGLCQDAQVMTVAHATVSVIENLGMSSVAEGIEDAAEVAALQAMGCRFGQGYLFARPTSPDRLLQCLQRPSQ